MTLDFKSKKNKNDETVVYVNDHETCDVAFFGVWRFIRDKNSNITCQKALKKKK
jgi:hypothetical protein